MRTLFHNKLEWQFQKKAVLRCNNYSKDRGNNHLTISFARVDWETVFGKLAATSMTFDTLQIIVFWRNAAYSSWTSVNDLDTNPVKCQLGDRNRNVVRITIVSTLWDFEVFHFAVVIDNGSNFLIFHFRSSILYLHYSAEYFLNHLIDQKFQGYFNQKITNGLAYNTDFLIETQ